MANPTSEFEVSWQDYLAVILLRKWFFIVPLLVSLLVGACIAIFTPRIYGSQAMILIRNEKLINPLIQGLAMPTAVSDRLNTLREEILSWSNLTKLIQAHKLDAALPQNDPLAYEQLVKKLRRDIRVRMRGDKLITIGYEGRVPAKVQELVNALTDIVVERNTAIQQEETATAVSFIEEEMGVYRQKLEDSQTKLREFKQLHMTQMPVVLALNSQLKDLELQFSTLLIDNTEEHPRVVEIKRQMEEVRRRRDLEIQRLVAKGVLANENPEQYEHLLGELAAPTAAAATDPTVTKARETYAAVVEGLESPEIATNTGSQVAFTQEGTTVQMSGAASTSLMLSPRLQQELDSLKRDSSVNAEIYQGLLQKLERAKITGRLGADEEGGKFVVIERARYPLRPDRPDVVKILLLSLVAGIALGIGMVMATEYLDQSVQTSEEAAELLQVPVLGSISTIVTEGDLEQRRRRRKGWISLKDHAQRLKTHLVMPIWSRVNRALLRWGL